MKKVIWIICSCVIIGPSLYSMAIAQEPSLPDYVYIFHAEKLIHSVEREVRELPRETFKAYLGERILNAQFLLDNLEHLSAAELEIRVIEESKTNPYPEYYLFLSFTDDLEANEHINYAEELYIGLFTQMVQKLLAYGIRKQIRCYSDILLEFEYTYEFSLERVSDAEYKKRYRKCLKDNMIKRQLLVESKKLAETILHIL